MVKMCNSYNIIYLPLPTVLMNGNSKRLHNKKRMSYLSLTKRRTLLRYVQNTKVAFSLGFSCQNSKVDSDMEICIKEKEMKENLGGQKSNFLVAPTKSSPGLILCCCLVLDVIQPQRILLILIIQTGTSSCKDPLRCDVKTA